MSAILPIFDKKGTQIFVGDILWNIKDNYAVVADGNASDFHGKLIASPEHSCFDIKYSLDNSKHYVIIWSKNKK